MSLELCKFGTCRIVKGFILFGFLVELDIKRNKLVNTAVFDLLAASPLAVSND